MHGKHRRGSVSTAVLLSLISVAPLAGAQAIAEFDLPAQPLSDSLRAIAKQTNTNVLFDGGLVNGRKAPALKGQASADAALNELLAGTGLAARYVDEKTIVVESADKSREALRKENAGSRSSQRSPGAAGAGRIRLAQAGSGESSGVSARSVVELEEIIVIGSHIRGLENSTAPVTVLDRAYIDATGVTTTTGLIEALPQNFALTNQSGVQVPGVTATGVQGSSINLRGIGEGTTLVLVNGRRMALGYLGAAADISALPLSAIERVEILTDGASALYGSDAIGGVVNFVLRSDFEGAETKVRAGWADGVNERRFSQALGNAWDSGNAVVSLEYYERDLLKASERDFVPSASRIGSLYPEDENYSVMVSGRQDITERVGVFADALYTKRDSFNEGGRISFGENFVTENPQVTATLGLTWQAGGDWQVETFGSYARNEMNLLQNATLGGFATNVRFDAVYEVEAAQVKADGSLFALPGGEVRAALGADWRSESFDTHQVVLGTGVLGQRGEFDQRVRSAFGEVYVPIVGASNAATGINRLELSLAGRLDDYSSFGSSFDPRVGVMWEPVSGLRLRGSHGTSYKAPNLADYNLTSNASAAFVSLDPGTPSGFSHQLQAAGTDVASLAAQESASSSVGFQLSPDSAPGFQLEVNYYRIKYTDRIAAPPFPTVMLADPAGFGSLFIRNPSVDQVNEFIAIGQLGLGFFAFNPDGTPNLDFDPSTVELIVDGRRRNMSVVKTSGLDLAIRYGGKIAGGDVHLGLVGTHILDLEHQITSTSDPFEAANRVYTPADLRARASMVWQREGWATSLFVNYTDSYTDDRAATPVPVSSHATVDARLAYDFSGRFGSGFLSGVTVAASAQNLLDRDPPRTAVLNEIRDMGFDPTNANPMGRFIAVEISKSW